MAQRTGTNLLALARVHGQDNDVNGNFGVIAADALLLTNDVLMRWTTNVRVKPKYIGASVSGLTFASGDVYKETGDNTVAAMRISEFSSFHPSNSATLAFPLAMQLERVTVDEIQSLLNFDGDNALAAAASEWTHVAAEKTQDATAAGVEKWRIWAYPVINRTRYMTVRSPVYTQLAAITEIPDIEESDFNTVARFLGWEIARLKRETDASFLASILAPIDPEIVQAMNGGAIAGEMLQDRVDWRDW